MSSELLFQTLVNALLLSMIYMAVAIGITLIISIMNLLSFVHGELYMLGGYAVYLIYQRFGYPYWLGIVVGGASVALVGLLLERTVFRPLRNQLLPALFVTMGIGLMLQTGSLLVFGGQDRNVATVFEGVISVSGVFLPIEKLAVFLGTLVMVGGVIVFVNYFRVGQALQAVSQDPEAAALMGINVNRISAMGVSISCGLAGVAGGLIAPLYLVSPSMGMAPFLKALIVIIIGGLGSIPGAVFGGVLLGFIDQFSLTFLGYIGNIFGFLIIMVILLFRPRGLLGRELRMH